MKIAGHDFLCESILGEDMKVKFRKYFIRLDFEVLKALKRLIVRKIVCFKDGEWLIRKLVKTITRPHSNFCVLVTAITNEVTEKDNFKFMLNATIRVCSLSAEY